MIVVTLHGSFGNQLRLYIIGYIIAKETNQKLVINISSGYNCFFDSYNLNLVGVDEKAILYKYEKANIKLKEKSPYILYIDSLEKLELLIKGKLSIKEEYWIDVPETVLGKFLFENRELLKKYQTDFQQMLTIPQLGYLKDKINESNCVNVAVHARRKSIQTFRGSLYVEESEENQYFRGAIVYYRKKFKHIKFYVFSDEMDEMKSVLGQADDICYVHFAGGVLGDLMEFFLMSLCDHRIMSFHSCFSWLSSYMCTNREKLDCAQTNLSAAWKEWDDFASAWITTYNSNSLLKFNKSMIDLYSSQYIYTAIQKENNSLLDKIEKEVDLDQKEQYVYDAGFYSTDPDTELKLNIILYNIMFQQEKYSSCEHILKKIMILGYRRDLLYNMYYQLYKKLNRTIEANTCKKNAVATNNSRKNRLFIFMPISKFGLDDTRELLRIAILLGELGNEVMYIGRCDNKSEDISESRNNWIDEYTKKYKNYITAYGREYRLLINSYAELNDKEKFKEIVEYYSEKYDELFVVSRKLNNFEIVLPDNCKTVFYDFDGIYDEEYNSSLNITKEVKNQMRRKADYWMAFSHSDDVKKENNLYVCNTTYKEKIHHISQGIDVYQYVRKTVNEETIYLTNELLTCISE